MYQQENQKCCNTLQGCTIVGKLILCNTVGKFKDMPYKKHVLN